MNLPTQTLRWTVGLWLAAGCGDDGAATITTTTPTTSDSQATDSQTPTTGALDNPSGCCSPAQGPEDCPADYVCCSDDPATSLGRLPNYFNGEIDDVYGVPIFSGANNSRSYSGQCVGVGGFSSPFTNGCPVPCNPTWSDAQSQTICGAGAVCCPFQAVDPAKDCVLDPETDQWRAVRGSDIPELTIWGDQHTTNQDPIGASCELFASDGGFPADKEVRGDCYNQLTVADQRGFCFQSCPCYEDLCDMKNPGWTPRC